ncbi:integrase, catalytic region, zinc finger, CCHC-type containing protein [Tanacetum coccineum]
MEDDVDINTLTLEQYLSWVQDDIRPGVRVLEIADLFHFPDITHDVVMLRVLPITLKGPALRWINRLSVGLVTTWDLLEKAFIRQYCPPFKTTKKLEIIRNFKQEMDETLYYAWERYNDLLFKCPHHDLNCQQKLHIFYTGLDIPTRRVLDPKGFIHLMTQPQALISIQVMAEHSHNCFKKYEGEHLTMEYPLEKEDKAVEQSNYDITVKDVERLRKILTSPIHALPNLKPIVQPYMPLGLVYNKAKVVKEEEQDYHIPLHEHVMQPLTPQTVHITPPDDDYVASATNPILNKHLNEFGEEFADNTRVSEKIDSNPVNDLKELLKTYDFENFIRKLKHQLSQSSHETGSLYKEMEFEVSLTHVRMVESDFKRNEVVLQTLYKKSILAIITRRREQHSW